MAYSLADALDQCSLFVPYDGMSGQDHDLPYRVELWDDNDVRVEELIALVGDHAVARAAFAEAIKCRPGKIVTLRQKTRLLADSRRSDA